MKNDKFEAQFKLETKKYFKLDIEHEFNMSASTRHKLVKDLIKKITSANIIQYNLQTLRFGNGQFAQDSINEYWLDLKHIAIESLKDKEDYIFIGFDEELTISIVKSS